jgi:hypothetical protein
MGVQPTPATRGDGACPFHAGADGEDAAFFHLGVGGGAAVVMEEEEEVEQSASPPPMSSCGRYILHRVCRFDTLAGVAIKYGVEVTDHPPLSGPISPSARFFFRSPHRVAAVSGWLISPQTLLFVFRWLT